MESASAVSVAHEGSQLSQAETEEQGVGMR